MHLSGVLQCNTYTGCMASPEIELFINLGISVVAFDKELCLLKVSKRLERKVGRPGIVERKWVLQVFGTPRESCEFPGRYYFRWQFGVGVVNDEGIPKLEWPCSWILSSTLDRRFTWIRPV